MQTVVDPTIVNKSMVNLLYVSELPFLKCC